MVSRDGLTERSQRHRLRCGDRGEAETNSERRCSKNLHGRSFLLAGGGITGLNYENIVASGLTSDDGASDGGANPSDAGASGALQWRRCQPQCAMAVPVPVMSPAHFLGLEAIDIVLRNDRGFRGLAARRHQSLR